MNVRQLYFISCCWMMSQNAQFLLDPDSDNNEQNKKRKRKKKQYPRTS